MYLYKDEEKIELNKILIGIYNKRLFKNNEYNALVGLEIFEQGGSIHEYSQVVKI